MKLLRDAHQASDEGENLTSRVREVELKDQQRRLTSRGRTSTISSGTKKIRAFIFLAIEMANLATAENIRKAEGVEEQDIPFCLLSS